MYKSILGDSELSIKVSDGEITINDKHFSWDCIKINESLFHIIKDNKIYLVQIIKPDLKNKKFLVKVNGSPASIKIKDRVDLLLEKLGMKDIGAATIDKIEAPMPGLILEVLVNETQKVKKNTPLLILEAMKMENIIKSPIEGVIKSIKVKKGQNVNKNQVLIQF